MPIILLVHVDPNAAAFLRTAAPASATLHELPTPAAALTFLEEQADPVDLLVLGADLPNPVRIAQQACTLRDPLAVLILCPPAHAGRLAEAIRFSPFLGTAVACGVLDDREALAVRFREMAEQARQQSRYARMLEAAHARMPARTAAQPASMIYLDRLLEHAPVGVVVLNVQEHIQAWNRQAALIFDTEEDAALGRSLYTFFADRERDRLQQLIVHAGTDGDRPPATTFERTLADGRTQFIDVTATRLPVRNGMIGTMLIFQDITSRVEAEQEARRLQQETAVAHARAEQAEQLKALNAILEQRNRELQEFAYVASHDLQEPLRKIHAFADLLWEDYHEQINEEGRHFLERMQHAARRMSRLLSDLLTYSRIATRAQPYQQLDLNRTLAEVCSDLELQIAEVGGTVHTEPLPSIEADPTQMHQLFQNLISNALKFHRENVPPVVHVAGRLAPADAPGAAPVCRITVQDNGIGFDEKYLDRIFTPFQRLHGRGAYPGTGMGLAICRRIIERHQGHLTADSTPGAGTTFIVTLPSAHPEP